MVGGMRRASVRERIFTSVPRLGPRPVSRMMIAPLAPSSLWK